MKKLLLILFLISSFYVKGNIHQIQVWNGYYQFLPSNNITVQLGDTVQWVPLDPPTMNHTITSDNIPNGAIPFDQIWQLPTDTFFQYIPQVVGLYQYVCTPHVPFGMIGEFTVVNGPQTYVPDDSFEAYLEANGMGNGIPNDDSVNTGYINTVISLDISNNNINDLAGIEDFESLEWLDCAWNQINSLYLGNNINLLQLNCNGNQLTNLDLTSNIALTTLRCEQNQLTNLDISSNTLLNVLECNSNELTSLNVINNTTLTRIECKNNQLISLELSFNTALIYLNCRYNQLTSLDLRNGNNINLSNADFSASDNPNLFCINVDDVSWSNANWVTPTPSIDVQSYFSINCPLPSAIQEYSTNKGLLKITDMLGRESNNKNQPLFYFYDDGSIENKIILE
jgi:plastocyanin